LIVLFQKTRASVSHKTNVAIMIGVVGTQTGQDVSESDVPDNTVRKISAMTKLVTNASGSAAIIPSKANALFTA
jgi:hypothetical protein